MSLAHVLEGHDVRGAINSGCTHFSRATAPSGPVEGVSILDRGSAPTRVWSRPTPTRSHARLGQPTAREDRQARRLTALGIVIPPSGGSDYRGRPGCRRPALLDRLAPLGRTRHRCARTTGTSNPRHDETGAEEARRTTPTPHHGCRQPRPFAAERAWARPRPDHGRTQEPTASADETGSVRNPCHLGPSEARHGEPGTNRARRAHRRRTGDRWCLPRGTGRGERRARSIRQPSSRAGSTSERPARRARHLEHGWRRDGDRQPRAVAARRPGARTARR